MFVHPDVHKGMSRRHSIAEAKIPISGSIVDEAESGIEVELTRRGQPECAIAAPVWHELTHGCRRLPKGKCRTAFEAYLRDVVQVSFSILPCTMRLRVANLLSLMQQIGGWTPPPSAAMSRRAQAGRPRHHYGVGTTDVSREPPRSWGA